MKYSRLSILCFAIACLVGCALVKVNAPFNGGQCVRDAEHTYKVQTGFGNKMRLVVGWKNQDDKEHYRLHEWAEYWNEDRQLWCLWDNDWRVGKSWYTADETGYITERILEKTYGN